MWPCLLEPVFADFFINILKECVPVSMNSPAVGGKTKIRAVSPPNIRNSQSQGSAIIRGPVSLVVPLAFSAVRNRIPTVAPVLFAFVPILARL